MPVLTSIRNPYQKGRVLAKNCTRKEIAAQLNVSIKTVETHCLNLLPKLNFTSDTEAAAFAASLKEEEPE